MLYSTAWVLLKLGLAKVLLGIHVSGLDRSSNGCVAQTVADAVYYSRFSEACDIK